jgi:hypothetical protein
VAGPAVWSPSAASVFATTLYIHLYIIFLLLCDSAVMFRELGLVRGMRTEVGEKLKTWKAAQGGAQQAAAELRGRLEKLSA